LPAQPRACKRRDYHPHPVAAGFTPASLSHNLDSMHLSSFFFILHPCPNVVELTSRQLHKRIACPTTRL
jgi:hypothetical protein